MLSPLTHSFAESNPSPEHIKAARQRAQRTQAQAAAVLGVSGRQYQRWEAGTQVMPHAVWGQFIRTLGYRYPADFQSAADGMTRGRDSRDPPRGTIENGDFVWLQPVIGPLIQARVWLDRVHDGLADEDSYGGFVIGFPDQPEAGGEFQGFYVGERVTFSRHNVLHLEQRVPGLPSAQVS
ncbi:helix-turn-helix domain-containing protein [Ralstonia pseudosolanacearum]|uniref:helix-turn-helix domain-containing protein n=1 Tax=Ralstonia pseudosolanacearum TaxID=1310165 RepID=UPI001FF7B391|nr:helix-turn-helix domain-containing protein [Ralstonia pseudosolanacearum]